MAEPLLEVKGLVAGYRGIPVVHGIDLTVDAGEVVVLLGPNGAGKTTTLLTISGLQRALDGEVRLRGESITSLPAHRIARKGVIQVPEDRSLFFGMTTNEHIRISQRSVRYDGYGLFPALEDLKSRAAGLLSGGEQQMLAMARALVMDPDVLLVDEMSLGLAPILVGKLMPELRRMAHDHGIGVLLVEQHVHLALSNADRAYVMVRGEIQMEGPAAQLAERRDLIESSYMGATALTDSEPPH